MDFSNSLVQWYLQNKRDLPWRETKNPYFIWLSEIMLQQTRVNQGLPYYFAFTKHFPTVFELANASEEQVLKLWQGLGYYSRARNLHKTAQYVVFELNGVFPENFNKLLLLKGVGEYTAAAIASFCYDEKVPVVDGNVFRVLSRFFEMETDISSSIAKKEFSKLAMNLMSDVNPALFNQAIMEFGALQCIPKNPDCEQCVLNFGCMALKNNKVSVLPLKLKKTKVRNRYFNYLIFLDKNNSTIIQKRTSKGIWHNLYEFPLIETEQEQTCEYISKQIQESNFIANEILTISPTKIFAEIHKLSHQHLHINFWVIAVKGEITNAIDYNTLIQYPFPIVIYNFIKSEKNRFQNLYL
jgi:A/G-specific adenine glycosylase